MLKEALENIAPMTAPGITPIKQVELATKWRPIFLLSYQDDICPNPFKETMMKLKESNKSTAQSKPNNSFSKIKNEEKQNTEQIEQRLIWANGLNDKLAKRFFYDIEKELNTQLINNVRTILF